jgi:hypothetical protein
MNIEESLSFLTACIVNQAGEDLNPLQQEIIRRCWLDQEYEDMEIPGYSTGYIKTQVAPQLWKLLSKVTGEQVSKKNLKIVLARLPQRLSSSSGTPRAKIEDVPSTQPKLGGCEGAITKTHQDLGAAPEVSWFYGRTAELAKLEQWIVKDHCRVVVLFGMGGIGKTALSVKLAQQIQGDFDYVIWRSLSHSPPLEEILTELIQFLSENQEMNLPDNNSQRISCLMNFLRSQRCLLILDSLETLLSTNQLAGKYRDGYQEYCKLFRQLGESPHQSCLILTSWEKSRELVLLDGKNSPVRSLNIKGLDNESSQQILRQRELIEEDEWKKLVQRYGGNPLALKIVAATIKEVFNGRTSDFLNQNTIFLGQISEILDQQFERLSDLEIKMMRQLAIFTQSITIQQLRERIESTVPNSELMETLESLRLRSLIEKTPESTDAQFTLQTVVRKYVSNRFSSM